MLSFLGGAPRQIVSDNLRAGITRACFCEPLVNRTYADMASHYDTAIIPARPYKPRDKAKVEVGVQVETMLVQSVMRSWTASSTAPTGSSSKGRACASGAPSARQRRAISPE